MPLPRLPAVIRRFARDHRLALVFLAVLGAAHAAYFFLLVTIRVTTPDGAGTRPAFPLLHAVGQWVREDCLQTYHEWIARGAGSVIRAADSDARVSGVEVRSPRFGIAVAHGCDAIELTLMFAAAVASFPARWRAKAAGIVLGVAAIAVGNFIRVTSLWFVGAYAPSTFEIVHHGIWPAVLACGTIFSFGVWCHYAAPLALTSERGSQG